MNFCNIVSLFDSGLEKNIENLIACYDNNFLLKDKIRTVSERFLGNSDFFYGKSVLLKPNWVTHNRKDEDTICLRTHDSFVLAALELILEHKPAKVTIGDAPIQGCDWGKMLSNEFLAKVQELSKTFNIEIKIKDFRRVTFDPASNNLTKERNPLSDYVIFDLGKDSALEPISSNKNIFRVTNYDPDRLAESHKKGVHKYCITKELFKADVVISMPKVKTHQKAGITCALKNLVGLNGDKDYLPHHRIGGTGYGGDCYPGNNIFRYWSEKLMDEANRRRGQKAYKTLAYMSALLWKITFPTNYHQKAAGWYGNDTTWRMVSDLNKIALYGKSDGTISNTPQRNLYSLSDGIIGGQGNGPLNPEPLPLGIISFTNHSGLNDICMFTLMGFDYKKVSLLKHQNINLSASDARITLDDDDISLDALKDIAIETLPPPGWLNYL